MKSPIAALAAVAYRAARWPIHTIVALGFVVVVCSVAFVDVAPHSPLGPLARTFEVTSAAEWAPLTADHGSAEGVPHYVGASVVFDTAQGAEDALHYVQSVLPVVLDGPTAVALAPDGEWTAATRQLREFEAGGTVWSLQPAFSWVVWARWYVARLADLAGDAPTFDLVVVGMGWIGMYYTFWQLFRSLRRMGSRTYLFAAALMSSMFAFLSAWALTDRLGLVVSKRALIQGLPFFVLVVGFDPKVVLVREAARLTATNDKMEAAAAIRQALATKGASILRDSIVEVLFLVGAALTTRIAGLWEFSILSALILIMDTAFLATFFAANLSLKLTIWRVERNHAIRRALQEDGVARTVAEHYAPTPAAADETPRRAGSLRLLLLAMVLAFNYMQLTAIPLSLKVHLADLTASPAIGAYVDRLIDYPCILTVVPPVHFSPGPAVSSGSGTTNLVLLALAASLMFNGYLVSLTRQNVGDVVKVPVVIERMTPEVGGLSESGSGGESASETDVLEVSAPPRAHKRSLDDCVAVLKAGLASNLRNDELVELGLAGKLPLYALEKQLKDTTRAVVVRRAIVSRLSSTKTLETSLFPYKDYDYDRVLGACCENVIGYLPLPLGVAGPIVIDGREVFLPMATTEGVLVASTMRGCKALNGGGGVTTQILDDGMTRGPCVTFGTAARTADAKRWLDSPDGQRLMTQAFNSTSRFARLTAMRCAQAGAFLYIRFRAQTGDAMGMNMISKGVEKALQVMAEDCGFEDMTIVAVSGNYCTDKKAAALNWIEGRGKSVIAEGIVPGHLVRSILKTGVDELVELNMAKNLVGSAMAGAMGGFNAHAANLVAAIFLATGQDPAQVVEGSNCMTLMSNVDGDLQISVSMPSLEVGTIGGGTILEPQAAMLDMLGVKGPHATKPGENAQQLARVVASGVLAGELSLCAALAAGHLVRSHMAHNRSKAPSAQPSATDLTKR